MYHWGEPGVVSSVALKYSATPAATGLMLYLPNRVLPSSSPVTKKPEGRDPIATSPEVAAASAPIAASPTTLIADDPPQPEKSAASAARAQRPASRATWPSQETTHLS